MKNKIKNRIPKTTLIVRIKFYKQYCAEHILVNQNKYLYALLKVLVIEERFFLLSIS